MPVVLPSRGICRSCSSPVVMFGMYGGAVGTTPRIVSADETWYGSGVPAAVADISAPENRGAAGVYRFWPDGGYAVAGRALYLGTGNELHPTQC